MVSLKTVTRTFKILVNFSVTCLRFCSARGCAWHLIPLYTLAQQLCMFGNAITTHWCRPEELWTENCGFFHLRVSTSQTCISYLFLLTKNILNTLSPYNEGIFMPNNYCASFPAKDCVFPITLQNKWKLQKLSLMLGVLTACTSVIDLQAWLVVWKFSFYIYVLGFWILVEPLYCINICITEFEFEPHRHLSVPCQARSRRSV